MKSYRLTHKLEGAFLHASSPLLPDKLYLRIKYHHELGKWPNIDSPRSFNEKLQWLKLYFRKAELHQLVDKCAVKDYVKNKIGQQYIIPTIQTWENVDSIQWDTLPDQYVLKTTHGGGGAGVVICKDKRLFNKKLAIQKLKKSLKQDIYQNYREWPYKGIERRILAETYIEASPELNDYKFFCFNGKVKCFKIDFGRFVEHHANYYNREGQILPFGEAHFLPDFDKKLPIPNNLHEMIGIAEQLASDFPFVRVDLYNNNGEILFGELTFFPAAGMGAFYPEDWDQKLGDWLILPNKRII